MDLGNALISMLLDSLVLTRDLQRTLERPPDLAPERLIPEDFVNSCKGAALADVMSHSIAEAAFLDPGLLDDMAHRLLTLIA